MSKSFSFNEIILLNKIEKLIKYLDLKNNFIVNCFLDKWIWDNKLGEKHGRKDEVLFIWDFKHPRSINIFSWNESNHGSGSAFCKDKDNLKDFLNENDIELIYKDLLQRAEQKIKNEIEEKKKREYESEINNRLLEILG